MSGNPCRIWLPGKEVPSSKLWSWLQWRIACQCFSNRLWIVVYFVSPTYEHLSNSKAAKPWILRCLVSFCYRWSKLSFPLAAQPSHRAVKLRTTNSAGLGSLADSLELLNPRVRVNRVCYPLVTKWGVAKMKKKKEHLHTWQDGHAKMGWRTWCFWLTLAHSTCKTEKNRMSTRARANNIFECKIVKNI